MTLREKLLTVTRILDRPKFMNLQVSNGNEDIAARSKTSAIDMANDGCLYNGLRLLFNYFMQNSRGAIRDEQRYSKFAHLILNTLGDKFLYIENLAGTSDQENRALSTLLSICCSLLKDSSILKGDFWGALETSKDWLPLEKFLEFCNELLDKRKFPKQTKVGSDATTTWSTKSSHSDEPLLLADTLWDVKRLIAEFHRSDPFISLDSSNDWSKNQCSMDLSSNADTESLIESISFDEEIIPRKDGQTSPFTFHAISVSTSPLPITDHQSKVLVDKSCSMKPETVEKFVHTDLEDFQNATRDVGTSPTLVVGTKSEYIQTDLIDKIDSSADAMDGQKISVEASCSPMSCRKSAVQTDSPKEVKIYSTKRKEDHSKLSFLYVEDLADLADEDQDEIHRKIRCYNEVC
uniref:Uncharacterized protein n=1 Tax=Romanomermis culicivorax TaxID=13658 RepID=A0A915KPS4_ROMCU